MEKRLILAIGASILILLIWSALAPQQPVPAAKPSAAKAVTQEPPKKTAAQVAEPVDNPLFSYPRKNAEVLFSESKAAISEVIFKGFQGYKFPLKAGFYLENPDWTFKKDKITADTVSFLYQDIYKRIIKRFNFQNSNYTMDLDIEIQNLSNLPLELDISLVLGALDFKGDQNLARFRDVAVGTESKALHPNPRKEISFPQVTFLGLRDRYFCAVAASSSGSTAGFIRKNTPSESEIGFRLDKIRIMPGQQWKHNFRIYLGPQLLQQIKSVNPQWQAIMYYGTFDIIAQVLLYILDFIYKLVHNWGMVIVILSLLIYFLLYPLTAKQMRSMKQMQALQPRIEELRRNYKDNPQRLNKEIMDLYRQNKANPFGGCLPLILQIPIFFALYQVLMRSVALKGSNFLWIKDLAEPDRLFTLPFSIPILGNEINLLPILMSIGMFMQQKMSMSAASGGSAEQQKIMLILFPLMFGFIFYHMPAGLVLYWFINSALMLIYQMRLVKPLSPKED